MSTSNSLPAYLRGQAHVCPSMLVRSSTLYSNAPARETGNAGCNTPDNGETDKASRADAA